MNAMPHCIALHRIAAHCSALQRIAAHSGLHRIAGRERSHDEPTATAPPDASDENIPEKVSGLGG